MLDRIDVPPVALVAIHDRMARTPRREPRRGAFYFAVAAAAIVLFIALPVVSTGLTQNIEAQIEAILRWKPPPPAPASVDSAMRSRYGTLAQAQARVGFTIVPPAGLPKDVVSNAIATTPTGIYSRPTHSWSVGSPVVWFVYRRRGGGSFTLRADHFDPREGAPSKYVFLDEGVRNGHEVLERYATFSWRNDDQVMSATAGEGLTVAEIEHIRAAMGGTPIPGVWPPQNGGIEKKYRLP
jgi:hypothetical protein